MRKYLIVVDSNLLFNSYGSADFNKFEFNNSFKNIIKIVEELNFTNNFKVVIPEIVWLEIKQQRKEKIKSEYQKIVEFNNKYSFPNVEICFKEMDLERKSDELLNSILNDYISSYNVFYDMPINMDFKSIVNRAIKKIPPFEGKTNKSDKGFKDAILWESIINYKKINENQQIIFYTNDKIFYGYLENEFQNVFNEKITIIKNEENLREYIYNLSVKKDLEFKKFTQEYSQIKNYILNTDDVHLQYKAWMEDYEAYGPGLKVNSISSMEILNIIESDKSKTITDSKFVASVNIVSELLTNNYKVRASFEPTLILGVDIIEKNISLELIGIEGQIQY